MSMVPVYIQLALCFLYLTAGQLGNFSCTAVLGYVFSCSWCVLQELSILHELQICIWLHLLNFIQG
jgi:hypothetical protein